MTTTTHLSRDIPLDLSGSALLVVDVQNGFAKAGVGAYAALNPEQIPTELSYYFDRINQTVVPNIAQLQAACRAKQVEVLFTNIECLTLDGRERGLDYKISGFLIPKGSFEAQSLDEVKPYGDEIVIPKSSSSVFNSTNIDYVLRNLGIRQLVVTGLVTDQCVEGAVRDACDLGYLVTLVEDACGTYSEERHQSSLRALSGYCRIVTTVQLTRELRDG
ncbi:MAG: isochorismatase family cysteine hydrolase [Pseudomonadota bacterium]